MICLTTLAFALAFAMPAAAAPPDTAAATSPQTQAQKPGVKEKKICKSDINTGSMMPKRTCMTAEEWAASDAANRKVVEDTLDQQNSRSR